MAGGKFILPGNETVSMSGDAARKLCGCGCGDAALLYVCILSNGGVFSREDAAASIKRTPEQVDAAMSVLARLGLVRAEDMPAPRPEPADELPEYTAEDVRHELENGSAFKTLTGEVQNALGKMLSPNDVMCLFGIYDHLGLPPEVILLLTNHCVTEYTARYGASRRPTMRYVEKAAYEWEREGVFSLEAAEEYLKNREKTIRETDGMAAALQIKGRALSPSERKYISGWCAMGFGPEAAAEAYDRTVLKTGRLTWSYMDSILKSWHSKNLHTPEEIAKGDRPSKGAGQDAKPRSADAPTPEDIRKNRKALEQVMGGK